MTPTARVAAAIDVLDRWFDGQPVERALTVWARGARYAGSKDRAAVRDHVYAALRQLERCVAAGGTRTGRGVMIGLMRINGTTPEEVFTGEGHAPVLLSPEEADFTAPLPDVVENIPNWLRPKFEEAFPGKLPDIASRMRARAPLFLRVNARKCSVDQARTALDNDGVETEIRGGFALEVTSNPRRVHQSQAYLDGLVEIQDLSPQLACAAINWPQSGKILDYCAGGGGKSLAIGAETSAKLFAHDAFAARMKDLKNRSQRAGINVTEISDPARSAPYQAVLCDVPCSGSGTWRRDPEAKWKLSVAELGNLQIAQANILNAAAQLTAPGGQLVYMTCSYFSDENEAIISAFLAGHPEWRLFQQKHFGIDLESDGFFLAELRWS